MEAWALSTCWWSEYEGSGDDLIGIYSSKEIGIKMAVQYMDWNKLDYKLDEPVGECEMEWTVRPPRRGLGMKLTRFQLDEAPQ